MAWSISRWLTKAMADANIFRQGLHSIVTCDLLPKGVFILKLEFSNKLSGWKTKSQKSQCFLSMPSLCPPVLHSYRTSFHYTDHLFWERNLQRTLFAYLISRCSEKYGYFMCCPFDILNNVNTYILNRSGIEFLFYALANVIEFCSSKINFILRETKYIQCYEYNFQ